MEFLLDTIHLEDIEKAVQELPINGVTSNPSIVKKEGPVPFFSQLRKIRNLIGTNRTLHAQVVGLTTEAMVNDAHTLLSEVDSEVYIKVPTNESGLAAMKQLKSEGVHVTATAIYTELQGRLAIAAGVDYIAPYVNRMVNMDVDAFQVISRLADQIEREHATTKILAASFHTIQQVNDAFAAGAQSATMGLDILQSSLTNPAVNDAVSQFTKDWESLYGKNANVRSLLKR